VRPLDTHAQGSAIVLRMLKSLRRVWKVERLAVLGLSAVLVAAVAWIFPVRTYSYANPYEACVARGVAPAICALTEEWTVQDWSFLTGRLADGRDPALFVPCYEIDDPSGLGLYCANPDRIEVRWFPSDRLPAVAAFMSVAFVLLLLRRK
jgi:hypothetical protein